MKLPSVYEPGRYEADIYKRWEQSRAFVANPHSTKEHFSISMPPPNETGTLHVGHALFITLQDILARHARQQGKDVLWLPGTDHAALATNAIIEKRLAEQGTTKHEIGRQKFVEEVRSFVGDSRNTINSQIRAMGASVDWSRQRYTLDPMLNRCVNEVFVKMSKDGLIYRGPRIVNWDPKLETTVSDDEVVHKDEKAPFYTLKYGPFEIGTARPETKFGDKYVVMHPDDKRYAQYKHGDQFEAEWINGKVTATVVKDEAVDPEFGTGVMTITPWHDHTDFEIAERHGLEKEQIIGFDGKLLPIAGEFAGLTIAEARPKIVDKLNQKHLLLKTEDYSHNIATNSRGGGVIEPQIKEQWFIDVNRPVVQWKDQLRSLREVMRSVVEDGDIEIIPKRFEKVYYRWIDNLRDWNISRQIWWGHRVPVWYKGDEVYVGITEPEGKGWQQDPDTLDTWFSSALWTWSTLLNPELATDYSLSLQDLLNMSPDFKAYHPTSVMETGWDILFFWVARMILATTYATGEVPFKTVYLHGLVRTEAGKKMSKSDPDTIIDPLEVIPEYGTDALRLALVSGVNAGQDQRLGRSKIVDNRNFCNKLWNIARYIEDIAGQASTKAEPKSPADHWILNKLSILTEEINNHLAIFRFSEAYQMLYHFVWDDLADWYIEASKVEKNPGLLKFVLEASLVITQPFAPFLTEVIWQQLGHEELLATEAQPTIPPADKKIAAKFEGLRLTVGEVRSLNTITGVKPKTIYHKGADWLSEQSHLVEKLAKLNNVEEVSEKPDHSLPITSLVEDVWIDIDPHKARPKVTANLDEHRRSAELLKKRLDQPGYRHKAPASLVKQTEQELQDTEISISLLEELLKSLKS